MATPEGDISVIETPSGEDTPKTEDEVKNPGGDVPVFDPNKLNQDEKLSPKKDDEEQNIQDEEEQNIQDDFLRLRRRWRNTDASERLQVLEGLNEDEVGIVTGNLGIENLEQVVRNLHDRAREQRHFNTIIYEEQTGTLGRLEAAGVALQNRVSSLEARTINVEIKLMKTPDMYVPDLLKICM